MTRMRMATIAVAVLASLVGCGSDDGEAAISRDDYVEQGDAICASGQAEINREAEERNIEAADLDTVEAFLTDVSLPLIRSQIDQLRDLGYPDGDRDELDSIYNDAEEILDEAESDPGMVLEADGEPFSEVSQRLANYGLSECA